MRHEEVEDGISSAHLSRLVASLLVPMNTYESGWGRKSWANWIESKTERKKSKREEIEWKAVNFSQIESTK